ncbi:MAG: AAA family ATPase, partial [Ruminococcus sp.]|nr:AAA family ATPase [Ruminococcus sp.]
DNINNTGIFPPSIGELVSGGEADVPKIRTDFSIEERLAQANGENREILLSKAANREQLEIAERIEKYNAVLVQGPPGTGKTHTIANLLGHFLSQGKNVLVTSYTSKALAVLKDKLPEPIKDLCVSVTGEDNKDMERSIDAISDYTASHTSAEMQRKISECETERNNILTKVDDVRKNLYRIKKREFSPIVFLGESYTIKQASEFIVNHTELSEVIPGKVEDNIPLPITEEEFEFLFKYNSIVTENVEKELDSDLPDPSNFFSTEDFSALCKDYIYSVSETEKPENLKILKDRPVEENLLALRENFVKSVAESENASWIPYAVADGKAGGGYKKRWDDLCNLIKQTFDFSNEKISVISANKIDISPNLQLINLEKTISEAKSLFGKKSKIGKLDLLFRKDVASLIESVKINGEAIKSAENCDVLLACLKIKELREKTAVLWNELLSKHGLPEFFALSNAEPERIAIRFVSDIQKYLGWDKNEFSEMKNLVISSGLDYDKLFDLNKLDSDEKHIIDIFDKIRNTLPAVIENSLLWVEYVKINTKKQELNNHCNSEFNRMIGVLDDNSVNSEICRNLKTAVVEKNTDAYNNLLNILKSTYEKYHTERKHNEILEKIKPLAPDWAKAIDARKGIYGDTNVSVNIYDVWKYRQLSIILDKIMGEPYTTLQEENASLSKLLRQKTAELASYKAWEHLLKRTESNTAMRQALQGYKLTVKKIGKGTGKNANFYRQQASEQMSKCQLAVPAWIMPVGRVMETLTPSVNTFDIVIVDEASQCDILCLGVLYMAKKIIIVGDDKQVSPLAVGVETDKINKIRDMYIRDKIPNWHLFEAKTSVYDIALTTFQPLMLREHFRCLPEIIGYSNKLSYDLKIKPLRDSGTAKLDCPVVNYRVKDGERNGRRKINENEANSVVALISACIEQPEYNGLTFGVISLLGSEQSKLIQNKLFDKLSPAIIEERKILCGDSANFQGDERDVIFLSLVDSNEGDGTLRKSGEGVDNSTKQRYNVAASRAKEQLWIVHSLDYSADLKQGDMRRDLLEYAENPNGILALAETVEKQSESPFEEAVAKKLISDGYSLIQQYEVGAYRIDMVVTYNGKKIAVECDGERWHSTEEQICNDMERQSVLERIGWQFIRIRGSEYFRNPSETMEHVEKELNENGIFPQHDIAKTDSVKKSLTILDSVKIRAEELLAEWTEDDGDGVYTF